jgi:hypothetical protein
VGVTGLKLITAVAVIFSSGASPFPVYTILCDAARHLISMGVGTPLQM